MGSAPAAPEDLVLEPEQLKHAHRRRAFQIHPDRAGYLGRSPKELEGELKALNEAYDLLRDEARSRPRTRPAPSSNAAGSRPRRPSHHWRGRVPQRAIPFGEFLYYSHSISWASLVDALAWQKKQRPMLGQIARENGALDSFAISHVQRGRERHERFGEAAVRLGYLTPKELKSLLATQFSFQDRIGRYFVEQGCLSEDELGELSRAHREHNARHL
ncbi:MAG: hypothetical protein AAFQ82_13810 [Myxococcota bacterium]